MSAISSLIRLFDIVDYLVDDGIGIVRSVTEYPREAGAPNFFHFYARACNTQAFCPQNNFADAGGASTDRGIAMAKAIGEAVERYCSAIYEVHDFPLVPLKDAPFACVRPGAFALYTRNQYAQPGFPYVPFEEETPVRWTSAIDLASQETCYVPAAMVFTPYFYNSNAGEPPIAQPISTGLAAHCSFEEAAISGICEVIERDAFTITWQAKLGRPEIRLETLSKRNRDLVNRFERTGSSITVLDLTMDHGVPTILSVMRNGSPDAPALVFAASASLDPDEAIRKSLEELAHTRRLAQQLKSERPSFPCKDNYENIDNQDAHVNLYCDHANAHLADFVFASEESVKFEESRNFSTGSPEHDLEILVQKIRSVGHRVLLADITTPHVEELGLKVVRAIIPGFHPLFMKHQLRAVGGTRLWDVPQKLGYKGITREMGDNPAPHPYP